MGASQFRLLLLLCLLQGIPACALNAGPSRGGLPAVDASQVPTPPANDPAAIFRDGKSAMETGRLAQAEEDFRRVIALDPKSAAAHVNLGVTYMREKRWDDALVELRKAESLSPDEPGIRLNIGLAYYRKDDFASAIAPFTATLQKSPNSSPGEISPWTLPLLLKSIQRCRRYSCVPLGPGIEQPELPLCP